MTALVWEDRSYEAGVDRGVLYFTSDLMVVGVPWNGLTAVEETLVGGDVDSKHLDGVNFLNVVGNRYFQAKVSAFSAPEEFGPYDGRPTPTPGIQLTNQPRPQFRFTYRVMTDDGYKIHLVYNCLATPDSRSDVTLASDVEPVALSWTFDAIPVSIPNLKPTAHFIVDSARLAPERLVLLEEKLYGTESEDATMPSILSILTMLGIIGEV